MNENFKLPFVINNINSVSKIINKYSQTEKHKKSIKLAVVFKEFYKLLNNTNISYMANLINQNIELVDYFIFTIISNAVIARKLNITKPILLLYPITPEETILASQYDIEVDCPNINWLKKTITLLDGNILKVHVWFDSGLSREGLTNDNDLYDLLKEIQSHSNIKLIGLGTKFNPDTHGHRVKCNELKPMPIIMRNLYYKHLIQKQIDKFNQIIETATIKNLISSNIIIHAACSNDVFSEIHEIFYDMIRVGALSFDSVLNNFEAKAQIVTIKKIPKDFCIGYYCINGHAIKDIRIAYIKWYKIVVPEFRYNNILLTPIESGDPYGLIIDDIKTDEIKVGDYIDVFSSNIYSA
jgi:alanine racemase